VSQDTAGNNRRVFAACHCSAPATALGSKTGLKPPTFDARSSLNS
jgi:hypothetical protein